MGGGEKYTGETGMMKRERGGGLIMNSSSQKKHKKLNAASLKPMNKQLYDDRLGLPKPRP